MSLAAETREAVRQRPFLLAALRAGVVNYTAAAEFLGLDGDAESVATALRRYAEDLPAYATDARDARVRMQSGVGLRSDADAPSTADATAPLLSVGGTAVVPDGGSLTAVLATGEVDAAALATVLGRLETADASVEAAGIAEGTLLVVVGRRDGAKALRVVEAALDAVPA